MVIIAVTRVNLLNFLHAAVRSNHGPLENLQTVSLLERRAFNQNVAMSKLLKNLPSNLNTKSNLCNTVFLHSRRHKVATTCLQTSYAERSKRLNCCNLYEGRVSNFTFTRDKTLHQSGTITASEGNSIIVDQTTLTRINSCNCYSFNKHSKIQLKFSYN